MDRIILHWTAGRNKASATDRKHYHFVIEEDGRVVEGDFSPEDNLGKLESGKYAAHTLRLNTGSIGIAVAGMWNAKESPFSVGPNPINQKQVAAMIDLTARLCLRYGIKVTPSTVLTHAEVEPNLGVKQRNKWDITWLPEYDRPVAPNVVGDSLRASISAAVEAHRKAGTTKPQRNTPAQSTTVQAGALQVVSGVGAAAGGLAGLDGKAQIVAVVLGALIILSALWIIRERLKKWADGIR